LGLEHHKKLPDLEFGFQKDKSCLDSLSLICSDTVNTFDNNKIIGAVLIYVYIMDTSSDEAVLKLENSARVKSISQ
jgi:hypothetical protein